MAEKSVLIDEFDEDLHAAMKAVAATRKVLSCPALLRGSE